jgi:hypothetical protein
MLVAVLMLFVVMSFTGVAVMNVSYVSVDAATDTKKNIINQYQVESAVNKALWRINNGVDSLGNFVDGPVVSVYDTLNNVLTINVDQFEMEHEISLDLSEDTHFDRALSVSETLEDNGNTIIVDESRRSRDFNFLPDVDMSHFYSNAVAIHNQSFKKYEAEDLTQEGIHIFTGSFVTIEDINLSNSTLVFTGVFIFLKGDNVIHAPTPVDSSEAIPALVFSNPYVSVSISEGDWGWTPGGYRYYEAAGDDIQGAIYCAGRLILRNGSLSGPVMGRIVSLDDDFDFLDTEFNQYYRWTRGFGQRDSYDWPKQLHRWKTKHWAHR